MEEEIEQTFEETPDLPFSEDTQEVETEEFIDVEQLSADLGVDLSEFSDEQISAIATAHKPALKGMGKAQQEAAELRKKAERLDQLLEDPKALVDLARAMSGEDKETQATPGNAVSFRMHPDLDYSEVLSDEAVPAIEALSSHVLDRQLQPHVDRINQLFAAVAQLYQDRESTEWDSTLSKYENADEYRQAAEELRRKAPSLTIEQAIHAVAGADLAAKDAPSGKRTVAKRKPVSLTKHSTLPGSRQTNASQEPLTKSQKKQSLVDFAAREAKRLGLGQ